MKADLPCFGGDIELCDIPLDFRQVRFSRGFASRSWNSRRTGLTVRLRTMRFAVITFPLWLRPTLQVTFMLLVRRGRVLRGDDRRGGGLATGTGEFLEEISELPENGCCQHHLALCASILLYFSLCSKFGVGSGSIGLPIGSSCRGCHFPATCAAPVPSIPNGLFAARLFRKRRMSYLKRVGPIGFRYPLAFSALPGQLLAHHTPFC